MPDPAVEGVNTTVDARLRDEDKSAGLASGCGFSFSAPAGISGHEITVPGPPNNGSIGWDLLEGHAYRDGETAGDRYWFGSFPLEPSEMNPALSPFDDVVNLEPIGETVIQLKAGAVATLFGIGGVVNDGTFVKFTSRPTIGTVDQTFLDESYMVVDMDLANDTITVMGADGAGLKVAVAAGAKIYFFRRLADGCFWVPGSNIIGGASFGSSNLPSGTKVWAIVENKHASEAQTIYYTLWFRHGRPDLT